MATANHSLTPQLRLRLITPACDLYSATEQDLADLKTTKGIDVCLAIMYSHSVIRTADKVESNVKLHVAECM